MRLALTNFVKLSGNVKELRIHLCQTGAASKGAREFVEQLYPALKKENPNLPILIRECSGVQPRLWARYAMGKESSVSLTDLNAQDVQKHIETMDKEK